MYKIKPQNMYSPPCCYVFISPMRYTSEWVCVQNRRTTPLFILFLSTDFYPNQVGPTKLSGPNSPRESQNNILLYSLGCYWPDLQWRLYLMTLRWPFTIITSRWRNRTSPLGYISKIHLEYPLKLQYSTLPLNEKVILMTTSS